jgi:hypothetical protein
MFESESIRHRPWSRLEERLLEAMMLPSEEMRETP